MRVDLGRHDCVSECAKSSLLETDNVDISRSGRNGSVILHITDFRHAVDGLVRIRPPAVSYGAQHFNNLLTFSIV